MHEEEETTVILLMVKGMVKMRTQVVRSSQIVNLIIHIRQAKTSTYLSQSPIYNIVAPDLMSQICPLDREELLTTRTYLAQCILFPLAKIAYKTESASPSSGQRRRLARRYSATHRSSERQPSPSHVHAAIYSAAWS